MFDRLEPVRPLSSATAGYGAYREESRPQTLIEERRRGERRRDDRRGNDRRQVERRDTQAPVPRLERPRHRRLGWNRVLRKIIDEYV